MEGLQPPWLMWPLQTIMSHKKSFFGEDHPSQEFLDNPSLGIPKGDPNEDAKANAEIRAIVRILEELGMLPKEEGLASKFQGRPGLDTLPQK